MRHFAKYCQSKPKQISNVDQDKRDNSYLDESDDEYLQKDNQDWSHRSKRPYRFGSLRQPSQLFNFSANSKQRLCQVTHNQRQNFCVWSFNAARFSRRISSYHHRRTITNAKFYVTQQKSKCILGYESSFALGLITLNVNSINPDHPNQEVRQILNKHSKLFQGTGNLKGREVKLETDPTVTPVAQPSRKIPPA